MQTVITLNSAPLRGIRSAPDVSRLLLLTWCVSPCLPAGAAGLRHELPDVHFLGSLLLLPGRGAGPGLRTLRVRLRNPRGKAELCRH